MLLALKWGDFDFNDRVLLVQRSAVHCRVDFVKTEYSHDFVPLDDDLAKVLLNWKTAELLHNGMRIGFSRKSRHGEALLAGRNPVKKHIKPAAEAAGLGTGIGCAYIPTHISDAPRRNWSADEGAAAGANAARQYSDDHERLWAGSIEHEAPSKQQSRSDGAQADSLEGAEK